ncbi:MAG: DUF2344 domain-containing protein [Firmicutes bacterium]|nr:DUF2344 domain-containing protein [Bacillota bacterium]
MNPERYRKRVVFWKGDRMRFVGHLDLLRVLQRAMNRAGIELVFSNGFNPHPQMSFAKPLSLGQEGMREIMELELASPMTDQELIERINAVLPPGILLLDAADMPEGTKSAMSMVDLAEYEIHLPDLDIDYPEALKGFLSLPEIPIRKLAKFHGRKQEITVDIRPRIRELKALNANTFYLLAVSTGEENLKPDKMMQVFWNYIGHPEQTANEQIVRTGLYQCREDGTLADMMQLLEYQAE